MDLEPCIWLGGLAHSVLSDSVVRWKLKMGRWLSLEASVTAALRSLCIFRLDHATERERGTVAAAVSRLVR